MKKLLVAVTGLMLLLAMPVYAHHAAEGIVDEEIYAMIDEMVADTPHADLDLSFIGGGMTEMTITTRTPEEMANLIDDGLLTYAAMLDGDVTITIEFDQRSVELTIFQEE